ncbi:MAG: dihydropyrimidinase [Phycisphaeraceae bacterium]|nr:dihydropyrimidinase [Phycisphaeraceae bacterium]MCB9847432.1 dihydropyrimidinase [Phycisphaeraceae bacterium]
MAKHTIIRGGTIHTASESFVADILIEGERIKAVGAGLGAPASATAINARGMDVIPGCLDVHVHLALPFGGSVSCDDFDSGTRGAACGGITTVIDFAIPSKTMTLDEADKVWHKKSKGEAYVDYTWHVALTDKAHVGQMQGMIDRGLPTFKSFMIYESEGWNSDDALLYAALQNCRKMGGMLLVHAESPRVLDLLIERQHSPAKMRKHGAKLHAVTRPNFVEAEAIERFIKWCEVTGGQGYVVHMSTGEGADLIKAAKARGIPVHAETCAQYLVLDDSRFAEKNGHLYACCPQIKKKADIERLWKALETGGSGTDGEVCVVSTDTCSFTKAQKDLWWQGTKKDGYGDWTKIPMGMPGLETMVPIVYTLGVRAGRISMNKLVDCCATTPAQVMGLGESKGRIAPGYDADVAIIDPKRTISVDWKKLQSNCDWSPFQGMKLGGFAHTTLCRGQVVVKNHKVVGKKGFGRFVKRKLG